MKVAPIECDLEQVVQGGDAPVTTHEQTPPNERVNLEVSVSRQPDQLKFPVVVIADENYKIDRLEARSREERGIFSHPSLSFGLRCFAAVDSPLSPLTHSRQNGQQ
jgi:hypothetical protein